MAALPNSKIEAKLLALGIIQGAGAFVAFIVHICSVNRVYLFPDSSTWGIGGCLVFLILFCSLLIFLNQSIRQTFAMAFGRHFDRLPKIKVSTKQLLVTARIFGIVDFFAIALLIFWSGGSEKSIYAPALFLVTPILILIDLANWKEIVFSACVSIAIFALGLCETCRMILPHSEQFKILLPRGHKICLLVSTAFCFIFPVVFHVLEKYGSGERED